jgi:hypothetical protein
MFLAGVVYNFSNKKMVQYVVLFAGLGAVYFNLTKMCDNVWWSREYHFIIAVLLVIVTGLLLAKKLENTKYLAYLLYADVLFGFAHSFVTNKNWK